MRRTRLALLLVGLLPVAVFAAGGRAELGAAAEVRVTGNQASAVTAALPGQGTAFAPVDRAATRVTAPMLTATATPRVAPPVQKPGPLTPSAVLPSVAHNDNPAPPVVAGEPKAAAGERGPPARERPELDHLRDYATPGQLAEETRDQAIENLFDGRWSKLRLPLARGDIGWKEAWALINPGSKLNTLRGHGPKGIKFGPETKVEAAMHDMNLRYVLGLTPRSFEQERRARTRRDNLARLGSYGAKIRAAYGLPPFASLKLPVVAADRKLGSGDQGTVYAVKDDPNSVVKVFDKARPAQIQEMAALMNALAKDGSVPSVELVSLADGRVGLRMARLDHSTGWSNLASVYFTRGRKARPLVEKADDILRAAMRETTRVTGTPLADWKQGLSGKDGDEYLDNFVVNDKTGEVVAFDPLVLW